MKLKSLESNRTYQKRRTQKNSKDPFEYTPRLVIPEFNIPTIKQNDDDISHSIDFSERNPLGQFGDYTDPSENRTKRTISIDYSKNTTKKLSLTGNPSEKFIAQISELEYDVRQKNQIGELDSKFDNYSDKNNYSNVDSQRNIALSATFRQKYQYGNNKRQSKYFTEKEGDPKTKVSRINQKESQKQNSENQHNKFKSNFSYMQSIRDKLSIMQRKVIAIAFVMIFSLKLKTLSGVRQIQAQKLTLAHPLKSNNNIQQLVYLNDFSLLNDKRYQQVKRENNQISQSLLNISRTELYDKRKVLSIIKDWISQIPVIHPDSAKLLFWDITNFIFIILNLTYVPIETVINAPFLEMYGDKCIILSTNLGYYDKGYCIMDRNKILKRYLKTGFWVDILSTFPMFVSGSRMNSHKFIKIFNLLVILKIQWVDKFFYKYFEICTLKKRIYHTVVLKFFYILLKVLFFAHCFACIFLAMAFHLDAQDTWVTKYGNGLVELGWFSKYVYAFYWGITIMTTVGLGDILPSNIYEVSVISLFMFVSCGTFAYSFNAIGIILEDLNQKSDTFVKEMRLVSRYLQMKNVDQQLQIEVRKYIEYKFDFENELSTEEEKIVFSRLSNQIQEKLVISTNMALIKNCNFLQQNFSEPFLMKLCLVMESESKLNEDIIFQQDDIQKENLNNIRFYILESGQVQLISNSVNSEQPILIRKITKAEYFGVLEFFTNDPRHYTAKAIGSTKLLSLDRSRFLQLLKLFPSDFEKFKMLCENAKMNNNQKDLKLSCYCCNKFSHSLKECPKIHYIANKEISILKNMYSRPQQRLFQERYQRIKINSMQELQIIQDRAAYFQDYNNFIINEECVTPYSPLDLAMNTQNSKQRTIVPHKALNYIQVHKLQHIPSFDQNQKNEIDSPEKLSKQNIVRQSSLAHRLSNVTRPLMKQNTKELLQLYNENHVDTTSKVFLESNYSPVMVSSQRAKTINPNNNSPKTNEMSQYGKEFLNSKRFTEQISPLDRNSFKQVWREGVFNIKKQEFMIDSFEKSRIFKTFFPHNNFDVIIIDYELARPKLKFMRYKKNSQYILFPKFSINKQYLSSLPIKPEAKLNMTFMDSEHIP